MPIEVNLLFLLFTDKWKGWVPERLMPLLGMEGLLNQMKDHARIHSHRKKKLKTNKTKQNNLF